MSYGIASMQDSLADLQDCEHAMHQQNESNKSDSNCCCDSSCDSCCSAGFHVVTALSAYALDMSIFYSPSGFFELTDSFTGLPPGVDFRPPIFIS